MKTACTLLAASALSMLLPEHAVASAGGLDPAFGQNGVVILPNLYPSSPFDAGNKVLIQPDGKILLVGQAGGDASGVWRSAFAAVRLNVDGSLDTSFGPEHDGYFIFPWGGVAANARAVLIAPDGDIVIGGNEGNRAGIVWLHPDGTFDSGQGPEGNGTGNFAVNQDDSHTTALNAIAVRPQVNSTQYELAFAGSYDGIGYPQMMIGSYDNPGPYRPEPDPYVTTVVPPGTNGNGVATSLLFDGFFSMLIGGYAQNASGATQCVVEKTSDALCYFQGDQLICGWFPDTMYGNLGGAFVDQFFSNEFETAAPCYVDGMAATGLFETIATGREFFGGGTRAVYFSLNTEGVLQPYYSVFAMTPWGDNSPREVVPVSADKWVLAGFSGADPQNTPDPVLARVDFHDNTLDPTFGAGGVSLLDFDPQDNAYGMTFGAAADAHGCIVSVGTYYNGGSGEGGRDLTQIFVSRTQGDAGGPGDTIFRNGFDPAAAVCGP
jgi:uncharacterized delta-60 repeat protein